ncbi:MAG TPA: hypothetical protein VGL73_04310, partial [Caulobacteraceae bacterium]
NQGGFCERHWTEAEDAVLREGYGKIPTPELARKIGRPKGGVFNRAWALGIKHGWCTPFSADEDRAIKIAWATGISMVDLSKTLDRDPAVVGKHARHLGVRFDRRPPGVKAPRTPRSKRPELSLASILALEDRSRAA